MRRDRIAPAGAALLAAAAVTWAWPDDLSPWRTLALVSAWAGGALLAASLALMVRTPRLADWLGGLDTMYRWHHRTGVLAYTLLLAHPLALAADGGSESPAIAWASLAPWQLPWAVNLGWSGLVLMMAGLAVTFSPRVSYRRWRRLHFGLGVALLLALSHVYALLGNPGPFLLVLLVALLALVWRLVVSDMGVASHPYRVMAVTQRAPRMIEATLAPCAAQLAVQPGQFVLAGFGAGAHFHGCNEFHPFTVSATGAGGTLGISVKALGRCTQHLQTLEPGVLVRVQGPFGTFLRGDANAPQLWVAGGVGITPFIGAIRAGAVPDDTTLVYLYRKPLDAAFLDELRDFAHTHPSFALVAEATGDAAPDLDRALASVTRLAERAVHVCGPPGLVQGLRARLQAAGIPERHIHAESFDFR